MHTKFIWVRPYRSPTIFKAFTMNNPTLRRHRRFPRRKPSVQWICRSRDYAARKSLIWNLKWNMEHLFAASLFISVAAWPKTSRSYSISFTSEIKQINLLQSASSAPHNRSIHVSIIELNQFPMHEISWNLNITRLMQVNCRHIQCAVQSTFDITQTEDRTLANHLHFDLW